MKITDGTAEFEIKELDRLTIAGIEGKTDLHSALHRYGDNPTDLKGLTNEQWHDKGTFISYFSKDGLIENQPSTYGQLINIIPTNDDSIDSYNQDVQQLFLEQSSGDIFVRGGTANNNIKDEKFKRCVMLKDKGGNTSSGWRLYSDNYFEYWTEALTPAHITYPFPVDDWDTNIQATQSTSFSDSLPVFEDKEETGFTLRTKNNAPTLFYIVVRGYIE